LTILSQIIRNCNTFLKIFHILFIFLDYRKKICYNVLIIFKEALYE